MVNRFRERCSTSVAHRETNQTTMNCHLAPVRMAITRKRRCDSAAADVEEREPLYTAGGAAAGRRRCGEQSGRRSENRKENYGVSVQSYLWEYIQRNKNTDSKMYCTPAFTAGLLMCICVYIWINIYIYCVYIYVCVYIYTHTVLKLKLQYLAHLMQSQLI